MKKLSYKDYKNRGYKFPRIAQLFNNSLFYIITGIIGLISLIFILLSGLQTIYALNHPPKPVSAWVDIKPENTAAGIWAKNFTKDPPPNVTNWKNIEDEGPSQPISFNDCNSFGLLPPSLYATYKSEGKEATIITQIYGTGTASLNYQNYKKTFATCWNTQTKNTNDIETSIYDQGSLFTLGDTIIFINSKDKNLINSLTDYYTNKAKTTLPQSGCNSIKEDPNDATRTIYYKDYKYNGYFINDNVKTNIDYTNLPTIIIPTANTKEYMNIPENPLPKDFPQEPKAPENPQTIDDIDVSNYQMEKIIQFQDPDDKGPGCGWAWSSQKAPAINATELQQKKQKTYQDAQNLVNANTQKYLNDKNNYLKNSMIISQKIAIWNNYTSDVKQVHNKWQWLNDQRTLLKPNWLNYVSAHDNWLNFDNVKSNAQKDYDNATNECNKQNSAVAEWEKNWRAIYEEQQREAANPTPTATTTPSSTDSSATPSANPTTTASPSAAPTSTNIPTAQPTSLNTAPGYTSTDIVPPRPEECTQYPSKPSILNQDKPSEPQQPTIPDGVTIPDSWQKPLTTPSVTKK